MIEPPKTAGVNKLSAMVRFLVRFVTNTNNLETRIEQLEKSNQALKKQLTTLKKQNNEYNRLVEEYNGKVAPTLEQETTDV